MSYAKALVVYGIPMDSALFDAFGGHDEEPEDFGFQSLYSGSSNITPGYYGIVLDKFDETKDVMDVSRLHLQPSDEEMQEFGKMLRDKPLPDWILEASMDVGVYFVWFTS